MYSFDFLISRWGGVCLAAGLLLVAPAVNAQSTTAASAPAATAPAPVSTAQRKAAETLLEVMQSEKTINQSIDMTLAL